MKTKITSSNRYRSVCMTYSITEYVMQLSTINKDLLSINPTKTDLRSLEMLSLKDVGVHDTSKHAFKSDKGKDNTIQYNTRKDHYDVWFI